MLHCSKQNIWISSMIFNINFKMLPKGLPRLKENIRIFFFPNGLLSLTSTHPSQKRLIGKLPRKMEFTVMAQIPRKFRSRKRKLNFLCQLSTYERGQRQEGANEITVQGDFTTEKLFIKRNQKGMLEL